MKKIFYLLLVFTIMACDKEEINLSENSTENFARGSLCGDLSSPFINQSVSFDYWCDDYPNMDCFSTELEKFLYYEFDSSPFTAVYPDPYFTLPIEITTEDIHFYYFEAIDTNDIEYYISANKANVIFKEIACQIKSKISELPALSRTWRYKIIINNLISTHSVCCSYQQGYISGSYKILKYKV